MVLVSAAAVAVIAWRRSVAEFFVFHCLPQLSTSYVLQGERMRLPFRSEDYHFPATMLASFDIVVVLIATPLLYGVVLPYCKRTVGCVRLTLLRRMGVGIILALLSVLAALLVEVYRRKEPMTKSIIYHSHFDKKNITASHLLIYYQIPQYVFFGVSEVFTVIAGKVPLV